MAEPKRPSALGEALRAAAAASGGNSSGGGGDTSSNVSVAASDSPSEEDYDELASPPAEAMVMRQRRPTHLRHEVLLDEEPKAAGKTKTTKTAHTIPSKAAQTVLLAPDASVVSRSGTTVPPPVLRQKRGDRKLSATVIFEEQDGTEGAAATATAAASAAANRLSTATTAIHMSDATDSTGSQRGSGGLESAGIGSGDGGDSGVDLRLKQSGVVEARVATVGGVVGSKAVPNKGGGRSYVVSIDDPKLAEMLREDLQQMREDFEETVGKTEAGAGAGTDEAAAVGGPKTPARQRRHRRGDKFRDFVFTRKFSAFDRQNEAAANSPFHGFFTLFWISVFLFIVKIAAENWRKTGSPLGTNEIMDIMFHRDVVVMLASDGVLCALTGVSWLLQRAVAAGWIDWDGAGWMLQNAWQALFVAGFIGWTQLRDWPWSHTVFFVLHGLVMLMKQHSFAFYNGYLSTVYKRRAALRVQLEEVESEGGGEAGAGTEAGEKAGPEDADKAGPDAASPVSSPTSPAAVDRVVAALQTGRPLDDDQLRVFRRVLRWEIDSLTDELRGKATRPDRAYPHNLTLANHYEYIVLPTLVYELDYPRSESISWRYAAEKLVACFGILFVMISISQAFIYPVVVRTMAMKEAGIPLAERFRAFPWMLTELMLPFMMEYLLAWYLIWETILNFLAELTHFADRSFYSAWWNSVTWDEFARDWNRPVHLFLLRHVYHSSISAMKVNKHTATLITFFLSACVHELVMWCIFKKLRGYLLFLQMCQLPLVRLSRTKFMRNRQTLGNVMFWLGLFMGPSGLCSLYLIL